MLHVAVGLHERALQLMRDLRVVRPDLWQTCGGQEVVDCTQADLDTLLDERDDIGPRQIVEGLPVPLARWSDEMHVMWESMWEAGPNSPAE